MGFQAFHAVSTGNIISNTFFSFQFLSVAQNKLKSLSMASQPRLQVGCFYSYLIIAFSSSSWMNDFFSCLGISCKQEQNINFEGFPTLTSPRG